MLREIYVYITTAGGSKEWSISCTGKPGNMCLNTSVSVALFPLLAPEPLYAQLPKGCGSLTTSTFFHLPSLTFPTVPSTAADLRHDVVVLGRVYLPHSHKRGDIVGSREWCREDRKKMDLWYIVETREGGG
jgi:hypothetical protein